jgi:hypothetical protein
MSGFGIWPTVFEKIVSESDIMADKTVFTHRDVPTDKSMRLYATTTANFATALYFNEWPDKYVIMKHASIDIGRHYNGNVISSGHIFDTRVNNFHIFPIKINAEMVKLGWAEGNSPA